MINPHLIMQQHAPHLPLTANSGVFVSSCPRILTFSCISYKLQVFLELASKEPVPLLRCACMRPPFLGRASKRAIFPNFSVIASVGYNSETNVNDLMKQDDRKGGQKAD